MKLCDRLLQAGQAMALSRWTLCGLLVLVSQTPVTGVISHGGHSIVMPTTEANGAISIGGIEDRVTAKGLMLDQLLSSTHKGTKREPSTYRVIRKGTIGNQRLAIMGKLFTSHQSSYLSMGNEIVNMTTTFKQPSLMLRKLLTVSYDRSSPTVGNRTETTTPTSVPTTTVTNKPWTRVPHHGGGLHPGGVPHMWSERQHNERSHMEEVQNSRIHVHNQNAFGNNVGVGSENLKQDPTGATHTLTYDHVQKGASHSGKPAVTRQDRRKEQLAQLKKQLHRTGAINDILKRPGVDPEITGDANLDLLSIMRLASMNLSELISMDEDGNYTANVNITASELRQKLRRRLVASEHRHTHSKHGRSRYSLVATRVRTRAKRSDSVMNDDYTWAVIVGGSGLAILIVVLCACVCARCNVDRKGTEAASTPVPTEPPMPAVFFVGGNNSADTAGVDNSGFAMGDLPLCHGAEGGAVPGPSTSGFGYSALKDDDDCISLRSATLELEKS